MDRNEILAALTALAAALDARGLTGEMYVVGGAAIAIAYDARRSTRDIDAVFEPKIAIYEVAGEVGDRLGLPVGWLNDAVKGSSRAATRTRRPCSSCPVSAASPPRRGSFWP